MSNHQGTALDHYLTKLVEQRKTEGFDKELRDRVHSIARKLSQQFNDSTIGRVAVRFALVQISAISPAKNVSSIESQMRSGEIAPKNASDLSDLRYICTEIAEIARKTRFPKKF